MDELGNQIFDIKEKLTDEEYKNIMDTLQKCFKEQVKDNDDDESDYFDENENTENNDSDDDNYERFVNEQLQQIIEQQHERIIDEEINKERMHIMQMEMDNKLELIVSYCGEHRIDTFSFTHFIIPNYESFSVEELKNELEKPDLSERCKEYQRQNADVIIQRFTHQIIGGIIHRYRIDDPNFQIISNCGTSGNVTINDENFTFNFTLTKSDQLI